VNSKTKFQIILLCLLIPNIINLNHLALGIQKSEHRISLYGNSIRYELLVPKSPEENRIIILNHGFSNDRAVMYPFANLYLANGFHVVLVESPNHGFSTGYCTLGVNESYYNTQIVSEISQRLNHNWTTVGVMGFSMGGYIALRSISVYPEIFDFAIAISPGINFTDVSIDEKTLLSLSNDDGVLPPTLNPQDFVNVSSQIHVFIGTNDGVVNPNGILKFCQSANISHTVNDGDHLNFFQGDEQIMVDFTEKQIGEPLKDPTFPMLYSNYLTILVIFFINLIFGIIWAKKFKRKDKELIKEEETNGENKVDNERNATIINTILLASVAISLNYLCYIMDLVIFFYPVYYIRPFEVVAYGLFIAWGILHGVLRAWLTKKESHFMLKYLLFIPYIILIFYFDASMLIFTSFLAGVAIIFILHVYLRNHKAGLQLITQISVILGFVFLPIAWF
jgi:pimeloyl-ACP methyl ester carboxylesterase